LKSGKFDWNFVWIFPISKANIIIPSLNFSLRLFSSSYAGVYRQEKPLPKMGRGFWAIWL